MTRTKIRFASTDRQAAGKKYFLMNAVADWRLIDIWLFELRWSITFREQPWIALSEFQRAVARSYIITCGPAQLRSPLARPELLAPGIIVFVCTASALTLLNNPGALQRIFLIARAKLDTIVRSQIISNLERPMHGLLTFVECVAGRLPRGPFNVENACERKWNLGHESSQWRTMAEGASGLLRKRAVTQIPSESLPVG